MTADIHAGRDSGDGNVILFVCPHGAGKSRIAAAIFDSIAPPGWRATTAGVTPQTMVSLHAGRLLAGTPAASALDGAPPRPVAEVPRYTMLVAIDCPTEALPASQRWVLRNQEFDVAMRDEIHARVADLVHQIGAPPPPGIRDRR